VRSSPMACASPPNAQRDAFTERLRCAAISALEDAACAPVYVSNRQPPAFDGDGTSSRSSEPNERIEGPGPAGQRLAASSAGDPRPRAGEDRQANQPVGPLHRIDAARRARTAIELTGARHQRARTSECLVAIARQSEAPARSR
jgi:hypothetical protein